MVAAPALEPQWLERSALLMVDMNRSHLDHSIGHMLVEEGAARRIIDMGVHLRDHFSKAGLPVIFVRTHHRHDARTDTVVDNRNPFWLAQHNSLVPGLNKPRKSLAIENAPVTEIVPELAPRAGEFTVFKHRYSPFENTDLEHLLRNLDVDTLVICGVNTNNCVLCSCFEAFNRDYRVILVEDVCASMNGPDYHEAAIKLIKSSLGWVVRTADVADALSARAAA
jgi:biuret amidohydrolase